MPIGYLGVQEEYSGSNKSGIFTIKDQFVLATEERWPVGPVNNLISAFSLSGVYVYTVQALSTNDGYLYKIYDDVGYTGARNIIIYITMKTSAICSVVLPTDTNNNPRYFGTFNWTGPTNKTGWGNTGEFPKIRLTPGTNVALISLTGRSPISIYTSSNPILLTVRGI